MFSKQKTLNLQKADFRQKPELGFRFDTFRDYWDTAYPAAQDRGVQTAGICLLEGSLAGDADDGRKQGVLQRNRKVTGFPIFLTWQGRKGMQGPGSGRKRRRSFPRR
ncbi:MAG: hypothetical protein Tsb0019_28630 [Roseibium sp.]